MNKETILTPEQRLCPLTNAELIAKVRDWVSRLCESGGRAWCLQVPVNFRADPDVLIEDLAQRLEAATPHPTAGIREKLEEMKAERHLVYQSKQYKMPERLDAGQDCQAITRVLSLLPKEEGTNSQTTALG